MAVPGSEIPALLKLLDDEHPTVRAAVKKRLVDLGPDLEKLVVLHAPPAEAGPLMNQAIRLRQEFFRENFARSWTEWLAQPSSVKKLESGLTLLATHLSASVSWPEGIGPGIEARLDGLTELLLRLEPDPDFRDLADFLFASGRFRGNEEDYYAVANSNLDLVLRDRQGNPILLACVMILVGARAGIEVGGCNFPAHFLARHQSAADGGLYLIDCFNGGKILPAELLIQHQPFAVPEIESVVRTAAAAEVIISRVLRNLEQAFQREGNVGEQTFVRDLWRSTTAPGE
ncbi:MAG: sirC expression regulator [Verrucomicrobia bacterium]|jgi:hypothetical protein|nr:MAG: sirC expression regulator [Verrucomicrobiota bacterium]